MNHAALIERGVRAIAESGDYLSAKIARRELDGRIVHTLWILGAPIAEANSAAECRRLLAAILLASGMESGGSQ